MRGYRIFALICLLVLASVIYTAAQDTQTATQPPQVLVIGDMVDKYEAVKFTHGDHMGYADNCATCHHHSEPGTYHACKQCHQKPFEPGKLTMPGLKGAYHRQCMNCHKKMEAGPVGCTDCHARKKTNQDKPPEAKKGATL